MPAVRRGFTLIEVLVALAVSAVVLSVAGLSLHEVASYELRGRTVECEPRRVERFRQAFSADLKSLVAVEGRTSFRLEKASAGGVGCDRVAFMRSGSLYGAVPKGKRGGADAPVDLWLVFYVCLEEGASRTLMRLEADPSTGRGVAVPVLRGVSHFSVDAVQAEAPGFRSTVERVAPDLLRVRVGFSGGSIHTFYCGPFTTHRFGGGDGIEM